MSQINLCPADQFLVSETERLYNRYQTEFVEALNLCPWAKRARLDGHISLEVHLGNPLDFEACLSSIDAWGTRSIVEIGLFVFPRLEVSREQFERQVAKLVAMDSQRLELTSPSFALAAFHPEAQPDMAQAERLIPFIRRTPDPTIQLVRISALERVRTGDVSGTQYFDPKSVDASSTNQLLALLGASKESLRERVSAANLECIEAIGINEATLRLEDILLDRQRVRAAYLQLCTQRERGPRGANG